MSTELSEQVQKGSISVRRRLDTRILEEIALSSHTLDEVVSSVKEFEELIQKYQEMAKAYAEKNKHFLKLNPDKQKVHEVVVGLARNKMDFGKPFCPCMVMRISGNPVEDKKRICPCYWHRKDIELDGECECGLFVKR